jgi:response regulator RpfG family c-di-GMP phosphodiesterase
MNLETTRGRSPLVLLVDPAIASRHFMWRALNRTFGVLEAVSADSARAWITSRPDIDALVVQDDLPDQSGVEFVRQLASDRHPIARRAIVQVKMSPESAAIGHAGMTLIEGGDLRAISTKLASWLLARDAGLVRALMREVDRLGA